jgi:GTP-binding protein Era
VIREKIYNRYNKEIPYGMQVNISGWSELPNGELLVRAELLVPRASQVSIVVGEGGAGVEYVAQGAKRDLSNIFGRAVRVELRVMLGAIDPRAL